MKGKWLPQIKVVEASNGNVFQRLYNEASEELSDCDLEIEIQHKEKGHCAYFMYTMHKPEQMTVKEALEAVGIHHTCSECPYLQIGSDARKKKWPCELSPYGSSSIDSSMCEEAYKLLAEGKLHLKCESDDEENHKIGF